MLGGSFGRTLFESLGAPATDLARNEHVQDRDHEVDRHESLCMLVVCDSCESRKAHPDHME